MLRSAQSNHVRPILIIDKQGALGSLIASSLPRRNVLLVSRNIAHASSFYHIHFGKTLPKLPALSYQGIIVVYDATSTIWTYLPALVKKAYEDRIPLYVVVKLEDVNDELIRKIRRIDSSIFIAILGQIVGEIALFWSQDTLNPLFVTASKKGRIVLKNWGMKTVFPVYARDAAAALIALVAQPPAEKLLYLFAKTGLTELSFCHLIQKTDPLVEVDFVKGDAKPAPLSLPNGKHVFTNTYSVAPSIKEVLREANDFAKKVPQALPVIEKKERKKSHRFRNSFFYLLFLVLFLILLPAFVYACSMGVGALSLLNTKNALESGNIVSAEKDVFAGKVAFQIANQSALIIAMEAGLFSEEDKVAKVVGVAQAGQQANQAFSYLFSSYALLNNVFNKSSHNPQADFVTGLNNISSAFDIIQKLEASSDLPKSIGDKLLQISPAIAFVKAIQDVAPNLAGFDNTKHYLLLFQNNTELRPTGGFIGSYGDLDVASGVLQNFTLHDVYEADGQLKTHVEPPFAIRRYLPSVNLYLRDSNFDIDFPTSASSAASIHFLETGKKVDGVIGVDLSFVKTLLLAVGPIALPDYKTTVTADNLFSQAEEHSQKNFFPGSTQKKDFLSSLLTSIQAKLFSGKHVDYFNLAQGFGQDLEEKHIMFAFEDASIQDLFTVNNYSDALWDNRTTKSDAINDTIGINEANLGVNKANAFLSRKQEDEVTINPDNTITGQTTLYYKNNSTGSLGGNYKAYIRIVLPPGSKITNIAVNDSNQQIVPAITNPLVYEKPGFAPPPGVELDEHDENGFSVFGFLETVPIGPYRKITIRYNLPFTLPKNSSDFTYSEHLIKQPGTDSDPYTFTLSYPSSYHLISSPTNIEQENGKVSIADFLDSDKTMGMHFAKK